MAIHEVDGTFSISSGGMWLPGIYDTPQAARAAFQLTDAEMAALWEEVGAPFPIPVGERRVVTSAHIRKMRARRAAPK